ncbi:UPF0481 protein At3g47200-like [Papaver somniferum]|uniref:UPF0481 protein At3g47200-like n=1 Tax=Papaver somniferum TaxID=3469 RepID=UPI000E6F8921|nr:UPF0481 protein At3g47200-like [Papaver somniferum]
MNQHSGEREEDEDAEEKKQSLCKIFKKLDLEKVDPYLENKEHKRSIFRLSRYIKEKNPSLYEPKQVSIGPNHYGKTHLMLMQIHKERALIHFLRRSKLPLQSYLDKLMKVVNELREAYEQLDQMEAWKDDAAFVMLMMLDGVFLLEFLRVSRGSRYTHDYASSDPIFGHIANTLIYDSVMHDLLLLENQLPYLVLHILVSISEDLPDESAKSILSWLMFAPKCGPGLHLLDMYLKGLMREGQHSYWDDEMIVKHPASKLHKRGIQFKRVQSLNGINFDKITATLKLPPIIINQYTPSTVLNLKTYELRVGKTRDFNSYIHLINTLVESRQDVMLLQSKGIIVNYLGSHELVLETIKEIWKDTAVDVNSRSIIVVKEMNKYYEGNKAKRCWKVWR